MTGALRATAQPHSSPEESFHAVARTSDPDVAALLNEADGDEPLRGTFFVNDARGCWWPPAIERAAREYDATLDVGFQDAARLDDEADVYRSLVREASVIAYGVGRPRNDIDGLEWVSVRRDRHALHNQWFLVLSGEESLAFVGYETSPPSAIVRVRHRTPCGPGTASRPATAASSMTSCSGSSARASWSSGGPDAGTSPPPTTARIHATRSCVEFAPGGADGGLFYRKVPACASSMPAHRSPTSPTTRDRRTARSW